jgi:GNAT superfamily N-acetyltransferase
MPERIAVSVRQAAEADLPAVLALYAQPDFNGEALDLDAAKAMLARFGGYPDYRLYVAEVGGVIAGTFTLLIADNLARNGRHSAVIEAVVVATERQGEGLGRAMLSAALEIARRKGCYKAALSSNIKAKGAHAFYDSLGFERHGVSFRLDLQDTLPETLA